ncbi:MAG TPA: hypothetical protein PKA76_00170 [Pirellulaceae bacterium]|nr:hypothetical protein [Pirellulaceae bacterium]
MHQTRPKRMGISLFEVLVSILVASVGVLGVLVLIPFAVKVAERGMDAETAFNHARNVFTDFEANGYRNFDRWVDADESLPNSVANPGNIPIVPGNVYLIDPLRIARAREISLGTGAGFPAFTQFPYSSDTVGNIFPNELEIRRISLRDQTRDRLDPLDPLYEDANALPLSLARRMLVANDDLNFDDTPVSDILGPTQIYFQEGGVNVRRQYRGAISSMVFALPNRAVAGQWILYTIVFKNRNYDPTDFLVPAALGGPIYVPDPALNMRPPVGQPRVFEVMSPVSQYNNLTVVGYGGGDLEIREINLPPAENAAIRSGDWLVLINGHFDPSFPAGTGPQNIQNLNFYRVIEWSPSSPNQRVTVVGPDFNFTNAYGAADPDPTNTSPPDTPTYAILIPDVLGVFERTIKPEGRSNYN